MGHQVVWDKVAVPLEGGEEKILQRGEMLPDGVNEFTLFVLTHTGGVKLVQEPDEALVAAANPPAPVLAPENPAHQPDMETGPTGTVTTTVARPNDSAVKAEWVDYAVANGADRAQAEQASKAELISKYGS